AEPEMGDSTLSHKPVNGAGVALQVSSEHIDRQYLISSVISIFDSFSHKTEFKRKKMSKHANSLGFIPKCSAFSYFWKSPDSGGNRRSIRRLRCKGSQNQESGAANGGVAEQ